MLYFKTYQVTDSSSSTVPFIIKNQEKLNGLELIEEVDEAIQIPIPKKKYFLKPTDTATIVSDTFYGIKNEEKIPIRNFQTYTIKEEGKPLEVLFNPTPKPTNIASWQIIILIVTTLMLGFAKAFSNSRFKQTIRALTKYSVAQEINREEKVFFHRTNIIFSFIYILILSLLIYQLKNNLILVSLTINNLLLYLLIAGTLMLMYFIKYLFSKAFFFILENNYLASEYIFNVSLYNNLLGILLIPTICIAYFSNFEITLSLIYLAFPLIIFIYLWRFIRLIIVGKAKGISYFYIFLYICTLEILPFVVLYRIFILK